MVQKHNVYIYKTHSKTSLTIEEELSCPGEGPKPHAHTTNLKCNVLWVCVVHEVMIFGANVKTSIKTSTMVVQPPRLSPISRSNRILSPCMVAMGSGSCTPSPRYLRIEWITSYTPSIRLNGGY